MNFTPIQLKNARIAFNTANRLNVSDKFRLALFEAILVESDSYNYANSNVPESLNYPHDKIGSDHDSLGILQQRESWGVVGMRMNIAYATAAFINAAKYKDKPEYGASQLAQAIQQSAYPSRYEQRYDDAIALIQELRSKTMLQLVKLNGSNEIYLSYSLMWRRLVSNLAELESVKQSLRDGGYDDTVKTVGSMASYGVVIK